MSRNDGARGASQNDPDFSQGANPKPTRGGLQDRSSAPDKYNTSGIESSMGALADKTHKRTPR